MKKIKKFANGLTLVYEKIDSIRSASIGVFVKTGSINECSQNNGISHFIEHCMFKGTKKRSQFDIVAETDGMGAAINAYTSKTSTCYYIQCVNSDFLHSVEILSDIFFNSVFPEQELEKEKGVVLEEIAMCNDTPDDLSYEIANTAFYKGHTLSRPILGTKNTVNSFNRDDILSYMSDFYTANNTIVSVAGNVDENVIEGAIEEYFASKFVNLKCKRKNISVPNTQSVYVKKFKKIEQANISILTPSVAYNDKDSYATRIFNSAFGFGMSGRIYQNIRERLGLAYSVYSYLSSYDNCGHIILYLGTNVQNIEKALVALNKEITDICRDGLTKEEFLRGKAQVKSSLVFSLESGSNIMSMLGKHCAKTGELIDVDKMILDIDKVTLEETIEAGRKSFDISRATVGYVGPKNDKNLLEIFKNSQKN